MYFKPRGSVTVFICILLAVIIPVSFILIDVCRYFLAVKQVETALKICADSMLAAYDRPLKDQYGLLALYPRSGEVMEEELFELLSHNLNEGASIEGVSDLYGFKVRKVEAIPFYNYSEPYVLDQQVAEFMKYRAPVQIIQEFMEKVKVMVGLMKESEMVEKKMSLDKLMNDIRSKLVTLHFMLKDRLGGFNTANGGTFKDNTMKTVSELVKKSQALMSQANSEVPYIASAQSQYGALYPGYKKAEQDFQGAQNTLSSLEASLSSKQSELDKEKSELKNATGSAITALDSKIESLEAEVESLAESYSRASTACAEAQKLFMLEDEKIKPFRDDLNQRLSTVIVSLSQTNKAHTDSAYELNRLYKHINLYAVYHGDLIALLDEMAPQLETMETQSAALLSEARSNDGSVSDRIQGDLEKQLKCIKKETFSEIKTQLSSNLNQLELWKKALADYMALIEEMKVTIESTLHDATLVRDEPQNAENSYAGYSEYDCLTGYETLEAGLSDLKSLDKMQGIYTVPAYELVPLPNAKEKEAFDRWFCQKYSALNSDIQEPPQDDTDLKNIRESVGSFAKETALLGGDEPSDGSEKEGSGGEGGQGIWGLLVNVMNLPSNMGSISSNAALESIGRAIEDSIASGVLETNPFDQPAQGMDTVNENEKNFFDYEMERISGLLDLLGNAVANGMESLIESLYMNEYIVSAFKNTATGDLIEYDIGWGRPLDSTYFDKAEVEYILFGSPSEEDNVGSVQRSLFAIRLVFNLLHVYSDPQKLSATLSLATTIAGWTVFGVPVVQNFLLISWAGLESYVDSEVLKKGGSVPLIKTSSSWYLQPESLGQSLKDVFLNKIKDFASQQIEKTIDDASEAIEETVMGMIEGVIDEAFAPIEEGWTQITESAIDGIDGEVNALTGSDDWLLSISFDSMDSFKESLEQTIRNKVAGSIDKLKSYGQDKLAQIKAALKTKIKSAIFLSPLYTGLVDKAKTVGGELLDKGIQAVEGKIDSAFGKIGNSRSNNITGRLIMMDYTDYLRLMLLAVPKEEKALRVADLMQLNMQEVSGNRDLLINQYNTYIFIKAEVDFNTWFLPEELFKKEDAGMISVEWSQGY